MLNRELIAWLRTEDGERAMAQAAALRHDPVAAVAALRRVWTREESAAALQQAELRRRAAVKFRDAHRMFFSPEALEQASGGGIARRRAERFRPFEPVADLCCGIGGDTLALSEVTWVVGVDDDAERLMVARANAEALGREARCAFVQARVPELIPRVPAAFVDPDRRPGGSRTRRLDRMRPSLSELLLVQRRIPNLGIKLSPALDEDELAMAGGADARELEFISDDGVCKEAVCWMGDFVSAARRATILPAGLMLTDTDPRESAIGDPEGYLFEPDPAVIRAHLVEQAAAALGARRIDTHLALLVGDTATVSPLARCFRIREVLRPNVREIGQRLRAGGYGAVVVKRRASPVEPEAVWRQLQTFLTPGAPDEAVVLFTRIGDRRLAILCDAIPAP